MASPTELARKAQEHSEALEQDFKLLKDLVDRHDLPAIRELLTRLDERMAALAKLESDIRRIGVLEDRVAKLEKRTEATEKQQERLAVVESQQADMKRAKEESDKRQWQFVYIFAGAMASLLVTVVVQLVLALFKKP